MKYDAIESAGEWHQVAFIVSRRPGELKLYIDGTEVTDYDRQDGDIPQGDVSNTDFRIGGFADSQGFGGMIDDVRLYNRTLGADEILEIYRLGR